MRYDTPIFFQHIVPGELDETTHNYSEDTITEKKLFACVSSSGVDTLKLVYGNIKQGSLTIRLQRPYNKPFNRIRIGSKFYCVDFSRYNKAFVVSEVQNNAPYQN